MKYILTLLLIGSFVLPGKAQFGKLLDKAKDSDVVSKAKKVLGDDEAVDISGGLKEALEKGVDEAVTSLSATNGYHDSPYKILLPEEARKVVDKLKVVPGFQDTEKKLIQKMNAAAESAAKKATPIFCGCHY